MSEKPQYFKFTKRIILPALIILVALSAIIYNLSPKKPTPADASLAPIKSQDVFSLVNEERVKVGLPPLKSNEMLNTAATSKALDMANNQYFSHYRNTDRKRGITFINDNGYQYVQAGENLAVYYDTAQEVVAAWMKSPSHRDNILRKNFTETGIGLKKADFLGFETYLIVQFFTEPKVEPKINTQPNPIVPENKNVSQPPKSTSSSTSSKANDEWDRKVGFDKVIRKAKGRVSIEAESILNEINP